MKKVHLLLLVIAVLFAASCKKELSGTQPVKQKELDLSKVFKSPTTPDEKILVKILERLQMF